MCGIVGYVSADPNDAGLLGPLVASMVHRGPDGAGAHHSPPVHIGMRRLSIIDPNGGWQPLTSRSGRVVVFQNGEIYNYRELRSQLTQCGYRLRTQSDTEVIAHGYDAWGLDGLLRKLDGMFAIAIHDLDRNVLCLARDRFGEKPLFFSRSGARFGFGSTLLSVAAMPWVTDAVDPLALHRYLALHFVPGERTILRDVRQLLPGESLTLELGSMRTWTCRYYQIPIAQPRSVRSDELASALEEAVTSRLVADVPVGVFLSGGLDSSTVAAIAAKQHPGIATFSMGFDDRQVDESQHAAAVARVIGSEHHSFVFDQTHFPTLLAEVAEKLDTPIGDQALLPVFWLSREARKHVTVALSGEGADEIFAGYSYYRRFAHHNIAQGVPWWRSIFASSSLRMRPATALVCEREAMTLSGFPILTNAEERLRLAGPLRNLPDAWEEEFLKRVSRAGDPLQRATAADIGSWLSADLLVKFDRMSMAHSLEGRAPFLSPRLAEYGLSLPPSQRMGVQSKVALRRLARKYLPSELLDRPKQGFVLPMTRWLADWFRDCGGPGAYFSSRSIPGLDRTALTEITEADLAIGVRRERLLFAIVVLHEWWRSFGCQRDTLRQRGSSGPMPNASAKV
jgi:asparagine synthase (glutamine-hydrolysing)